jgi:hypothetical protein
MHDTANLDVGLEEHDAYLELIHEQQALEHERENVNRMLAVSETLESYANFLDGVEVLRSDQVAPIRIGLENLLSGTGYDVDILIPSLESFVGGTVSTEDLKSRLGDLYKRIVQAVLKLLSAIKNFWNKIRTYQGRLRMNAEVLKKQGAIRRGVTIKSPTVQLGLEARTLMVGTSPVNDPDQMIRACASAISQYKTVIEKYPRYMLAVGKDFENTLVNGTDPRLVLEGLCIECTKLPFGSLAKDLHAMAYRDTRFGTKPILLAPPAVGGYSLYIATTDQPTIGLVGNDLLTQASRLRGTGMRFTLSDGNVVGQATGSARTASGAQVEVLATRALDILDLIDRMESARMTNKLDTQVKAVLSAADRFKNTIAQQDDAARLYTESAIRFARSYASWAIGPIDQMTTNLLTVCRAILIYGKKSLSAQTR